MTYKILEQNGIDNENIDGAAFNNFCAGNRDGIIKGVLNECAIIKASENTVTVLTGELIICGFRIKVQELTSFTLSSTPVNPTRYQLIADLTLTESKSVEFDIICRVLQEGLIQEPLYKTNAGHYQVEIARFTHTPSNNVEDLVRTLDVITGGTSGSGGSSINIGQVNTQTLAPGLDAEVDVEPRYDEEQKKWVTDFQFSIPQGRDGSEVNPNNDKPLMDGTANAGVSLLYARGDHRHPTDTTRASTAVATQSTNGLMSAADKRKLDGVGTSSVTGVKGNDETNYRTGNVNLTPENIGAVNKSGDTMTGPLTLSDSGLNTNDPGGYNCDRFGNFKHLSTGNNTWNIQKHNGTSVFSVNYETGETIVLLNDRQYSVSGFCLGTPTIQYNNTFKSGFYDSSWAQYDKCFVCGEGSDKAVIQYDYNDGWHLRVSNGGNEVMNFRWIDNNGALYDNGQRVWSNRNRPTASGYNSDSDEEGNTYPTQHTGETDTVVSYYCNPDGNTWYRIWASGWKEMGGSVNVPTSQPYYLSLPLSISFPMSVSATPYYNSTTDANVKTLGLTSNQLGLRVTNNGSAVSCRVYWYMCGF